MKADSSPRRGAGRGDRGEGSRRRRRREGPRHADAQREVANLTVDLAEKVVGENLDRQTQLGLVERYIAELER
jgi:hypothetical protein